MILGLDLSLLKTGYCLMNGSNDVIISSDVIETKLRGVERLIYIREAIQEITLNWGNPDLVVLEGYSMGSKGHAFSIGELGGLIKTFLYEEGYEILIVPPKSLKKFVTGNGNSGKDLMLLKTYKKYGKEFEDDNICDAYGLCMVGKAYLQGTDIEYEKEVLKKVEIL